MVKKTSASQSAGSAGAPRLALLSGRPRPHWSALSSKILSALVSRVSGSPVRHGRAPFPTVSKPRRTLLPNPAPQRTRVPTPTTGPGRWEVPDHTGDGDSAREPTRNSSASPDAGLTGSRRPRPRPIRWSRLRLSENRAPPPPGPPEPNQCGVPWPRPPALAVRAPTVSLGRALGSLPLLGQQRTLGPPTPFPPGVCDRARRRLHPSPSRSAPAPPLGGPHSPTPPAEQRSDHGPVGPGQGGERP